MENGKDTSSRKKPSATLRVLVALSVAACASIVVHPGLAIAATSDGSASLVTNNNASSTPLVIRR